MCVYDIFLIGVSSSSRMTVLDCKRSIIRKGSIFIPSQELCTKNGMPTEQFSTLQYSPIWRERQITWIICVCFLHIDVHWNRNWVILLATVQIKLFYVWLLNFYWIAIKRLIEMVNIETWLYNWLSYFKYWWWDEWTLQHLACLRTVFEEERFESTWS